MLGIVDNNPGCVDLYPFFWSRFRDLKRMNYEDVKYSYVLSDNELE